MEVNAPFFPSPMGPLLLSSWFKWRNPFGRTVYNAGDGTTCLNFTDNLQTPGLVLELGLFGHSEAEGIPRDIHSSALSELRRLSETRKAANAILRASEGS
jgi:hypothetical protein